MKKRMFKWGLLVLVLVFGVVVAGYAATIDAGRYDPNSPPENDCTLTLKGTGLTQNLVVITKFDGQVVEWRGQEVPKKDFRIKIPAGTHTLVGQMGFGPMVSGTSFTTTFTFVAGHIYRAEVVGSLRIVQIR